MSFIQEHFTFKNLGIYICLSTGLRIGEVCALTWDDIKNVFTTDYYSIFYR